MILVVNSGSSSVKFRIFRHTRDGDLVDLARGIVEELFKETARFKYAAGDISFERQLSWPDYPFALGAIFKALMDPESGVIKSLSEIHAVGHRAVHGGDKFTDSVIIDEQVIAKMEQVKDLAPLHNPANLKGIYQCVSMLPNTPQVAVFDTAFHQTIPEHVHVYPLPYRLYEKEGIRQYGFHGTSCQYVMQRVEHSFGVSGRCSKIVICHLGNGVSVTAVKNGQSVDTSLGFTSVGGMMMGSRVGDLDPGVMQYMLREMKMSSEEFDHVIHKESGLVGVSGRSNDMRELEEAASAGDHRSFLAIHMFAYRLKRYIGAYAAAMGGLDVLVFTAGIGENSSTMRSLVVEGLDFLGLDLDTQRNESKISQDRAISSDKSTVKIVVIPANEEKMIAQEAIRLLMAEEFNGLKKNDCSGFLPVREK